MQLDNDSIIKLLGVIIAGGVGVSLVAQFLKKKLGLKTNAVIHTVVIVLACLTAFAQYFQQIHSQLPPVVLGISTTAIYGISQMVFKYASYGGAFASKVNAYNQGQNASANDNQTTYTNNVLASPDTTAASVQSTQSQRFEL